MKFRQTKRHQLPLYAAIMPVPGMDNAWGAQRMGEQRMRCSNG